MRPSALAGSLRSLGAGLALAVVTALAASGCAKDRGARPEEDWAGVEFAGCAALRGDGTCVLDEARALTIWVPEASAGAARVTADEAPIAPRAREVVQGGERLDIAPPPQATRITVLDGASHRAFRLHVVPRTRAAPLDTIVRLRDAGDVDGARRALDAFLPSADGKDRAEAIGLLARILLARGELGAAVTRFREAIALDRASGLLSAEADDALALTFTLDQRMHRYGDARAVLRDAEGALARYPEGGARRPYYEGLLKADTGDVHGALAALEEAQARTERLGMARLHRLAESSYALQLAGVGRHHEALRILERLVRATTDVPPCDRADLWNAKGTWMLGAIPELDGAEDAFTAAAALSPACPDVDRHALALLGLAEVALRRARFDAARAWLAEARLSLPNAASSFALAALDFEARMALAEGHPARALASYDDQARLAGSTLLPKWSYAAAVGRGEAFEALGKTDRALAAYAAAEELLNEQSSWIPLAEGRATFLADRERSARLIVDLLVRLGRVREALTRARIARSRAVAVYKRGAQIERLDPGARAEWERSIETYRQLREATDAEAADDWRWSSQRKARELPRRREREAELHAALDAALAVLAAHDEARPREPSPPAPGELVVAYHPVPGGWIGFGATCDQVTAFRFALPPAGAAPSDVAERLLGPLRARIAAAARLRVLAYGPLREVDLHALPWEGGVLLDALPVTYGFDGFFAAPTDAASDGALASVISDPNGDLPAARHEAERVAAAVRRASGWSLVTLARDDASSSNVLRALTSASLFHYAGHASFAGRAGVDSVLPLAAGGRLTVGDVLALPHVPRTVVLSSCEAARTDDEGASEALGLASAFVAAGAESVVAPVRPIRDALAADIAAALYEQFGSAGFVDTAAALRSAQLAVRARAPSSDWAAFRVVVP